MIHAYQEIYLNRAMKVMGEAFDYAINSCGVQGERFVSVFSSSPQCKNVENGEPAYIAGRSGIEFALEILGKTEPVEINDITQKNFGRSVEYWIGWAVAYYQWYSGRKYSDIFKALPYENLEKMYDTLHEADVTKFADIVDNIMRERFKDTNLKRIRTMYGVSQSELSKRSGVSLRSIQMYEQRNKNINKACVETIYQLSKVLGCSVEELIER